MNNFSSLRKIKSQTLVDRLIFNYVFFFLLFLGFVIIFIQMALREYAIDDAYIHFRVTKNFVDSETPYFNLGEPMKVSTSTGWIILLTSMLLISKLVNISLDLNLLVTILNALMIISGALIYLTILEMIVAKKLSLLQWITFMLFYVVICLPSSLALMETVTALAVIGIGVLLLIKGKMYAFIFVGMSIFFRPEFLIPAVLTFAYACYKQRQRIPTICFYLLVGLLPFIFFDLYFYGTIIPQSVTAKSIIYQLSIVDAAVIILLRIRDTFFMFPFFDGFSSIYLFYSLFIPLFFIALFLLKSLKQKYSTNRINTIITWVFFLWGTLIFTLYIVRGVYVFFWYDPLYLVPLLIVLGFVFITTETKKEIVFQQIILIPLVIVSVGVIVQNGFASLNNPAYFTGFSEGARARQYITIGEELYSRYPDARLMTSEIGGLGFGFDGHILDAAGLATPNALKYHKDINPKRGLGGIPLKYIIAAKPDIIVSYDLFIEGFFDSDEIDRFTLTSYPLFLEDDRNRSIIDRPFGEKYQRILWGIEHLYVFTRKTLGK